MDEQRHDAAASSAPKHRKPPKGPFRREDETLLRRLEDQALFEAWLRETPALSTPLPRKCAGIVTVLRTSSTGSKAVAAASRGQLAPLHHLLSPSRPQLADWQKLPPEALHHLALLHRHFAWFSLAAGNARRWHLFLASAAFLILIDEHAYFEGVAADVLDERESPESLLPLAQVWWFEELCGCIDAAISADRRKSQLREVGSAAFSVAQELPTLLRELSLNDGEETTAQGAAARVVEWTGFETRRILGKALASVDNAFQESIARGLPAKAQAAHLHRATELWRWAHEPEDAERFVLDRVMPLLWRCYRERDFKQQEAVLRPLIPLVRRMVERVEESSIHLAYAAPCAQFMCFWSDIAGSLQERLRIGEHALRVCPNHSNAKIVVADLLTREVLSDLRRITFMLPERLESMHRKLVRAEALYPELENLREARELLDRRYPHRNRP